MLTSPLLLYSVTAVCAVCCGEADGYVYEVKSQFWVVDAEVLQEDDGSKWRRSLTFMCASTVDEHFRVEEE